MRREQTFARTANGRGRQQKKQIPCGNDSQKSKSNGKGNCRSQRNDNQKGKGNCRSLRDDKPKRKPK